MIHFLSLNIWYVIYVVFWIKYWNLKLPHHCIPFLFTICTVSQLFWNQVCKCFVFHGILQCLLWMIYPHTSLFLKFMCLLIFNLNILPSLFQQHLFSDDVFIVVRAGQPVTHMRSTNNKPQPSNQFPMDKIKLRPTFFPVQEADTKYRFSDSHPWVVVVLWAVTWRAQTPPFSPLLY